MSRYISDTLKQHIRDDAKAICGYCQTQERIIGSPLEIDHLIPISMGGQTIRSNLWLACSTCNCFKANLIQATDHATNEIVPIFNPRNMLWYEHFTWIDEGLRMEGLTPVGRATVELLRVNNDYIVRARFLWIQTGWHPPS